MSIEDSIDSSVYKIRRERCRPFRAAYESRKEQKLKST